MAKIRDASGIRESTEVNKKKDLASKETAVIEDAAIEKEAEIEPPEKVTEEEEAIEDDNDEEANETDGGEEDDGEGEEDDDDDDEVPDNDEQEEETNEIGERVEDDGEGEEDDDDEVPDSDKEEEKKDTEEDDSDDDESQPMQPEKMYFGPSEYNKVCKIGTRCSVRQTVEYLEKFPSEARWFRNHDQFKHVFHMPKESNHMLQGMWMLLLRTVNTEVDNEWWFVVNGVPVRYSMREHALLTGFDCHEYPQNWEELGDMKFVKRVFGAKCNSIKVMM